MLVTPALAAEWLKSNTRNRRASPDAVADLVAIIRGGRWRVTHQGIAFGADRVLYDGQHRLLAVVESGIAVEMLVTHGLSPADRDAIDNGGLGVRRPRHVLAITDGIDVSKHDAANATAARSLIDHGNLTHGVRQTAWTLRADVAAHGPALAALHDALVCSHVARLTAAAVVASLAVAWRTEPERAVEFAAHLRTGENLGAGHPALALRNYLLSRSSMQGGGAARDDLSLRTFGAFDAYVRGASMKQLKANEGARDRYIAGWKRSAGGAR
jgi:hypothetical protein